MADPVVVVVGILVVLVLAFAYVMSRKTTAYASVRTDRERFLSLDQEFKGSRQLPPGEGLYLVTFCDMDAGAAMAGQPDPPPRWCATLPEAIALIAASDDDEQQIAVYDRQGDLLCFTDGCEADHTHRLHYRPCDLPAPASGSSAA